MSDRRLLLAAPRSFCAGVKRAIEIAETAVRVCEPPIYCLKEIVHNRHVVNELRKQGVKFVQSVEDVPKGSTILFSAHGVSPDVRNAAAKRRLDIIDATCPFVAKVHTEVRRYARDGCAILLVGDPGHDEIVGVAGEAPDQVTIVRDAEAARAVRVPDDRQVAVVTQTTLSVDETDRVMPVLRKRFPDLRAPAVSDICYATTNRQKAVVAVAKESDLVIVLGSENSSNSKRLIAVAAAQGCRAELVDDTAALADMPLEDVRTIGLTAGASTPEHCVRDAIDVLRRRGFEQVEERSIPEEAYEFPLPLKLQQRRRKRSCP